MTRPFSYESQFIMHDKVVTVIEDLGCYGILIRDSRNNMCTINAVYFEKNTVPFLCLSDISDLYDQQEKRSREEFNAHRKSNSKDVFKGFFIDYGMIHEKIQLAIQYELGFTRTQAEFITKMLLDRYTDSYQEVLFHAGAYCHKFKEFLEISGLDKTSKV